MKKQILAIVILLTVGLFFNACKEHKGEHNSSEEHNSGVEHASEKADMALNDMYQCPMNCEDGKTYDDEGKCPICKMDLKKIEGKQDGDKGHGEHDEHNNDESHTEDQHTE
jgi:hypothetical protein